jgi:S-DNA-T family DNA segregation ATPase FtsK/SpoIIIE
MASSEKKQKNDQKQEVLGILLMVMAFLLALALISYRVSDYPNSGSRETVQNWLGLAGAYVSHLLFVFTIGYASFIIPFLIFLLGWVLFLGKEMRLFFKVAAYTAVLGLIVSTALGIPEAASAEGSPIGFRLSGLLGGFFAEKLHQYLGTAGSIVLLFTGLVLIIVSITSWSIRDTVLNLKNELSEIFKSFRKGDEPEKDKLAEEDRPPAGPRPRPPIYQENQAPQRPVIHADIPPAHQKPAAPVSRPEQVKSAALKQPATQKPETPASPKPEAPVAQKQGEYVLPPIDLLALPPEKAIAIDKEALERKAHFLEEKLAEFDVQGTVTGIQPGPVITRFEVTPAAGVKVSRFTGIQDDLALVMRASRVRVVAPIPGKAAVGIELPNEESATVYLRSILGSDAFQSASSKLLIALGKTIDGKTYVTDLADLPHLLVAGSTGSGKSVCLNTIITSMLYKSTPAQVKFVLIDPKKLELSLYQKLRGHHLTTGENLSEEVITTVDNAVAVLKCVEREMEKRYRILARLSVRNVDDFNKLVKKGAPHVEDMDIPSEPMPYIVVIVDELADLMATGAREVEEPIARLAQMSRAVGIHLILATQRPSVDVITGVIKANFPARIAFQVIAKTDSRTILDRNGAEKLLGKGDMLFLHPREPEPIRIHGAFISTEEVQRVVRFISQQPPVHEWRLPGIGIGPSGEGNGEGGERDELFWEAARLVVRHQQGSASLLQRRLRVGYARAGRLIDELEAAGIIGPFDGSKARQVLMDDEDLDRLEEIESSGLAEGGKRAEDEEN